MITHTPDLSSFASRVLVMDEGSWSGSAPDRLAGPTCHQPSIFRGCLLPGMACRPRPTPLPHGLSLGMSAYRPLTVSRSSVSCAGLKKGVELRFDPVLPHHLVVLVLDDVAVPDVARLGVASKAKSGVPPAGAKRDDHAVTSPGYILNVSFQPAPRRGAAAPGGSRTGQG